MTDTRTPRQVIEAFISNMEMVAQSLEADSAKYAKEGHVPRELTAHIRSRDARDVIALIKSEAASLLTVTP